MQRFTYPPSRSFVPTTALLLMAGLSLPALAHDGRNFAVQVVDDGLGGQQLRLQGFNTLGPEMGVAPTGRSYYGAVHDHFESTSTGGRAEQPGFLVNASETELLGASLTLEILGAQKWVVDRSTILQDGSALLAPGIDASDIALTPLSADETISVFSTRIAGESASTAAGGEVLLTSAVTDGSFAGADDIEVIYEIGQALSPDAIYIIESVLHTSAVGVGSSESFYTILSPDGGNGRERLHFPSLLVEQAFGTALPVPEPGAALVLGGLLPVLLRRRRGN